MPIPLLVANWKMYKTGEEAREFFREFQENFPQNLSCEVAVCPPFTLLELSIALAKGKFSIGAQDVFFENEGAYTGEISPRMLKSLGCRYVIVGHSERRGYFGETDETVNKKVRACLKERLIPIVCVGESLSDMEQGKTGQVVTRQILQGFQNISVDNPAKIVVAYEPIWAIGTGKADTPEQSNKTIGQIRESLVKQFGDSVAKEIRILYGGSVRPENIQAFMAQPEINGGLVGGASLTPPSFLKIIASCSGDTSRD